MEGLPFLYGDKKDENQDAPKAKVQETSIVYWVDGGSMEF